MASVAKGQQFAPTTLLKFDRNKDINSQFKFLSTIGKGAYGSVILVQSATDPTDKEIYAIKILKYHNHYRS